MISVILLLLYKYHKILEMYGAQKVGKQGRDIDDGIKQFSIQPPYRSLNKIIHEWYLYINN